ncbi:MAG TPA: class I SAM-dependent methyltransferase [Limnochordia bacterium]
MAARRRKPPRRGRLWAGRVPPYAALARLYDAWMGESFDYPAWADQIEGWIERHAPDLVRPWTIVDLACGTGRLSQLLAERGHTVVGTDRSPAMLRIARQRTRPGERLAFRRRDLRRGASGLSRRFDVALCLCDSLNYLLDRRSVGRVFARAAQAVRPGGLLIFDVNTVFQLAHGYGDRSIWGRRPECAYLWRNAFDPRRRRVEIRLALRWTHPSPRRWSARRGPHTAVEIHREQAHSARALERLARRAGWHVLARYDGLTDAPPRWDSDRITWVLGRRPRRPGPRLQPSASPGTPG